MSTRQQRIQTLYEISLAIKSRETLDETADGALSAYLQKLNCSVGAVIRVDGAGDQVELSTVASIPANPERNELFCTARDRLANLAQLDGNPSVSSDGGGSTRGKEGAAKTLQDSSTRYSFDEPFPVTGQVGDTGEYHLLELPGFGVILLGKRGGTVSSETVSSLTPLNEKLAQACRSNLAERQLREQRNRFEAMFDAIPEPVVNVVIEDGTECIVKANDAFQETFVGDRTPIRGTDLNELVVPDGQSADTEKLIETLEQGEPLTNELKRKTRSGLGHFLFNGVPVEAGEKTEYFGVYVDITDQKEREQRLERYQSLIEHSSEHLLILDEQGRVTYQSPVPDSTTDYEMRNLVGDLQADHVHPDDRESLRDDFEQLIGDQDEIVVSEFRLKTKDGEWRWFENRAQNYLADPLINGVLVSTRDITARKERERTLERYETMVQATGDPMYTLDETGHFTSVNDSLVKLVGLEEEELVGDHVSTAMPPGDVERGNRLIQSLLSSGETRGRFEMQVITADGQRIPCETHVAVLPFEEEFDGTVGVVRDISERVKREAEIQEQRQKYEQLVEQSPQGIAIVQDNVCQFVNSKLAAITGYDESALLSMEFDEILAPEYQDIARQRYEQGVRGEQPPQRHDIEIETADGERRYINLEVSQIQYQGNPAVLATYEDITERKQREQQLEQYRQRLSVALETAEAGIWEWDIESDDIVWDESMETLVNTDAASLGSSYETFRERIHDEDVSVVDETVETALETGRDFQQEFRIRTGTGEYRWISTRACVFTSEDGSPERMIAASIDITDQKEREQTLDKLYQASNDILRGKSRSDICEQTVDTFASILEQVQASIHLYDRDAETFQQVASTDTCSVKKSVKQKHGDSETVFGDVYREQEVARFDAKEIAKIPFEDAHTEIEHAVILPLGMYGLVTLCTPQSDALGDEEVYFSQLLVRLVETALERVKNERGLTAAQTAVRDALQTDSHEEMAQTVVEQIPDGLGLPIAGIWKYNAVTQTLEPLCQTEKAKTLIDEMPTFEQGDSIAWQTFDDGSATVISEISTHPNAYNPESPMESEISVPIGDFGLLTAGSTRRDSFTELDADILEILAANVEVISQVIEQRQDIRLLTQVIDRILRHNIRNELTPLKAYANTILHGDADNTATYAKKIGEKADDIEKISEHARQMRQVVESRSEMTAMSLKKEVQRAVHQVESDMEEGEISVTAEATPTVTAHPALGIALHHLIRNGIEHNISDNPRVEIYITEIENQPAVKIADNGPGIDEYELSVLDKHGESALEHGSGAGLWIVDRVIEYSEGLITFDTTEGTTATVVFPTE